MSKRVKSYLCGLLAVLASFLSVRGADYTEQEQEARLQKLRENFRMLTDAQRAEVVERIEQAKLVRQSKRLPREVSEEVVSFIGGAEQFPHIVRFLIHSFSQTLSPSSRTEGAVNAIDCIPDTTHILGAYSNAGVKAWDYKTGSVLYSDAVLPSMYSVCCRPQTSKQLVAAGGVFGDGKIVVMDTENNDSPCMITEPQIVWSVRYNPRGTHIASASNDTTVKIWDAHSKNLLHVLEGSKRPTRSVRWSADNEHVAAGSEDGNIYIWNGLTGTLEKTLQGHKRFVNCVQYSPDGTQLVSGSADTIKIWNVSTGAEVRSWVCGTTLSVDYSPDGKHIVSGSTDKTVKIWNADTGALVWTLGGHTGFVNAVTYSPDGTCIISGSSDGSIKIWPYALILDLIDALNHIDIQEYAVIQKIHKAFENPTTFARITKQELATLDTNPPLHTLIMALIGVILMKEVESANKEVYTADVQTAPVSKLTAFYAYIQETIAYIQELEKMKLNDAMQTKVAAALRLLKHRERTIEQVLQRKKDAPPLDHHNKLDDQEE